MTKSFENQPIKKSSSLSAELWHDHWALCKVTAMSFAGKVLRLAVRPRQRDVPNLLQKVTSSESQDVPKARRADFVPCFLPCSRCAERQNRPKMAHLPFPPSLRFSFKPKRLRQGSSGAFLRFGEG
jgi:hypothetical protein